MMRDRRDGAVLAAAAGLIFVVGGTLLAGVTGGGGAPPDGFMAGCSISFSGDDTVIVQPGLARDADDTATITVASAITLTTADQAFDAATGGGLDTGAARVASTWYYAHLANSSTVAILLSTSRTAPTLPAGVTATRMIGAGRADTLGDWLQADSYGSTDREFRFVREDTDDSPWKVVSAGAATVNTKVSLTAVVPPEADGIWFWMMGGVSAWGTVSSAGYPGFTSANFERVASWNADATRVEASHHISVSRVQEFSYRVFASNAHISVQAFSMQCDGTE